MPYSRLPQPLRSALLLGPAILVTGCAYTHGITPQEQSIKDEVAVGQYMPATREMRDNIETQELFAQAAFWSHEYELNPTDLEATLKLAAAVRRLGNPGRAVEITQTSRQIHPRDPYLLAEHAAGLIADQRAMDAVPILEQGLRVAPSYGRLWSLRGAALDQMENYAAARESYSRALQITPNDPNVLTNLGLSHALSGDLVTAESWLQRAVSIPGAGPSARENLALVLQLQGREEEAQHQARLAGLHRPDRQLPPAPVPAFTPRGAPAQLAPSQTNLQARPSSGPQQSPFAPGTPSARLTTVGPDGQAFTSSAQAARQASGQRPDPHSLSSYEGAPAPNGYGNSMAYAAPSAGIPSQTPQQAYAAQPQQSGNILTTIRDALRPGAVTPPAQQMAPAGPQPYLVGQPSSVPPQPQVMPDSGVPQWGAYPSATSSAPEAQTRRGSARRRR